MQPQSKLLKWSLILGIVIVTNLFVNYSISLVYSEPQYNDFCAQSQVVSPPTTQVSCVSGGGQWVSTAPAPAPMTSQKVYGYCNPDYVCGNNYSAAQAAYERNVFIALVSVGVILIVVSFIVKTNSVVSTALSLAGVLSLVIASMRYWSSAGNWLKVLILAVALLALIALALKKFKNESLRS